MTRTAPPPEGRLAAPRRRRTVLGFVIALLAAAAVVVLYGTGAAGGQSETLSKFLVVVAVILVVSHLCGEVMRKIGQPPVLGEIVGGILLGPSALGLLWPGSSQWAGQDVLHSVDNVAQFGLVVFMFLLGCELRTGHRGGGRQIGAVIAGGMGLPFVAGIGLAFAAGPLFAGTGASTSHYVLFFGLAIAVTAVPVLARILVDLKVDRTEVGGLCMASAAIGDGLAWLVLAGLLAGTGKGHPGGLLVTGVLIALLVLVAFLGVRPLLARTLDRVKTDQVLTVILVVGAMLFAGLTQVMYLHPVIGAFLFGVVVPRGSPRVDRTCKQLQGFTVLILLPLFFAGVGLKTSIGMLGADLWPWLMFAAVVAVAVLSKVAGAAAGARLAGLNARRSLVVGMLMNCRGVTELVIAAIGLQAGMINEVCFTILVFMAVVTTATTGFAVRAAKRRGLMDDKGDAVVAA